ncbi:MAG: DUF1656 domain-containing protein [Duganella sp.]
MPRDMNFFGVLLPGILPLFLLTLVLQVALDSVLNQLGIYRRSWHPALVRVCLFVCIFSALLITLYK